ncbi:GNAT family N-acetyltransferase [Pantoea sp. 1.19]|uniref:GNAT family N-acetyltransferase n=1 Tax=Pantoea sp. 1.19 TaxID=1925589 RepID=UPI000948FDD1|nr:GNAT family N-acetyltransferase [Pantoea sp. 1.19]
MTQRSASPLQFRLLQPDDNAAVAAIIRTVSAEFGLTADKGFAVADPQLDDLYEAYATADSAYWVVVQHDKVVGGGGIAPLAGGEADICELQKMYLLPAARGQGAARELVRRALDFARQRGFKRCYLETTAALSQAVALYEQLGFIHLDAPLGKTGHGDCEIRMLRDLLR